MCMLLMPALCVSSMEQRLSSLHGMGQSAQQCSDLSRKALCSRPLWMCGGGHSFVQNRGMRHWVHAFIMLTVHDMGIVVGIGLGDRRVTIWVPVLNSSNSLELVPRCLWDMMCSLAKDVPVEGSNFTEAELYMATHDPCNPCDGPLLCRRPCILKPFNNPMTKRIENATSLIGIFTYF